MEESEPFPLLNTSADHFAESNGATIQTTTTSRRRRSSALAAQIRGDTGAPALATSYAHMSGTAGKGLSAKSDSSSPTKKYASKRRRANGLLRRAQRYALKHTWALPLFLIACFLGAYAVNPTESNPIHHFLFLSYRLTPSEAAGLSKAPTPSPHTQYGKGPWDIALVVFYTIFLSFTREFIMQELLRPLAKWSGLHSRAKQARFMEQMYTAVYFGVLGPAGMFVMSRTPVWYFNVEGMYENFPHMTHDACFKFYYLFQAAYWAQQFLVLVLGLEKPRKDYYELVGHHIVSLALITLSYRFHFTYMGLAVYITHDVSDFFLATSKSLSYVDSPIVAPYFFLFMSVWIYMRHYLNLRIILSLFYEFRTVGPYQLDWDSQQYKCLLANVIAGALLSSLQALNLFWLYLISKIAYRFTVKGEAEDDREEGESEEEEQADVAKDVSEETKSLSGVTSSTTANVAANGHSNGTTVRRKK